MYNKQEVQRGIALLDEKDPAWRESIDFEHLDMHSVWGCVLGQWRGKYYTGLDALGITPLSASAYGFNVHSDKYAHPVEHVLLAETWRTLAGSEPTPSSPGGVLAPERELVFA